MLTAGNVFRRLAATPPAWWVRCRSRATCARADYGDASGRAWPAGGAGEGSQSLLPLVRWCPVASRPAALPLLRSFGSASTGEKKKKKNRKEKKEQTIQEMLSEVEEELAEAEKEPYGKYRGRDAIKKQLRKRAPSNARRQKINSRIALDQINYLLYRRHALRSGFESFNDMSARELGESFLGSGTKIQVDKKMGREIIKCLWRRGAAEQLEHLRERHEKHEEVRKYHEERRKEAEERKKQRTELRLLEIGETTTSEVMAAATAALAVAPGGRGRDEELKTEQPVFES